MAQVVERLTRLALSADDLLHVLAGCTGAGAATNGRAWPGGWEAVDAAGDRTLLMRQQRGGWQLVGVDGPGWQADYAVRQNGVPRELRLRSADARVDFSATVRQLELNTSIDPTAFDVTIPEDTRSGWRRGEHGFGHGEDVMIPAPPAPPAIAVPATPGSMPAPAIRQRVTTHGDEPV